MFEYLYRNYIESYDLFTVTVFISVVVHMVTVLSCSAIPFMFQFFSFFDKYKIQETKNYPLKVQFQVAGSVLFAQVVYQGPFIVFNYYFFKYFAIPYDFDSIPHWSSYLWKLILCLILEDAWHYWAHRALHHKWLYKRFHKQHHSFTAPFAIQSEYAHPFETVFTGIGFFIPFALWCDHLVFLWIWMAVRVAETTDVHSGYDIPLSPFYLLPGYAGARVHDFHHYNFEGNYAPTFVWWDYICGTDNYYQAFKDKNRQERLSKINENLSLKNDQDPSKSNDLLGVCSNYSYVVTGGSGMVGKRILKMLTKHGAKKITSIDIVATPENQKLSNVSYVVCDILNLDKLQEATKDHNVLIHTAALVGPYHPYEKYMQVNVTGTLNVISVCKTNKIQVLIDCSTPTTRMNGTDICGAESSELLYAGEKCVHQYGYTKALGEMAVLAANCPQLRTCAIAPHQVYGEEDQLFLPNVISAAQKGQLRVFGNGENIVSFTYVDNIAYALILAGNKLMGSSYESCSGKFYVVTDGDAQYFWKAIDLGCRKLGFDSVWDKKFISKHFAIFIGYLGEVLAFLGKKTKLNVFAIKMLMNNRYFSIKQAQKDFGYKPLFRFEEKWTESWESVLKQLKK